MDLGAITQLLQSNPFMVGQTLLSGTRDPAAFAQTMDNIGMPTPGTPEWEAMLNPFSSSLGSELAGGPPPVMGSPGSPAMLDPRNAIQTSDVLAMMNQGQAPQPGALGGAPQTQAALQQQNPLGRIQPPKAQEPKFSGGIANAQKVPDADPKAGLAGVQGLLQALLGGATGGGQVPPTLGAFLR